MKSGIFAFLLLITVSVYSPHANVQQVNMPIINAFIGGISSGISELQIDSLIEIDQFEGLDQLQIIDSDLNEARGLILEGLESLNTAKKPAAITIDSLD